MEFRADMVSLASIGDAVARRRINMRKTQVEMARLCDINHVTLSRIEGGLVDLRLTTLLKVCEGLAMTPGKLVQLAKLLEERDSHAHTT